jgi:hypothetical protein
MTNNADADWAAHVEPLAGAWRDVAGGVAVTLGQTPVRRNAPLVAKSAQTAD